jgi:hypothetical protein
MKKRASSIPHPALALLLVLTACAQPGAESSTTAASAMTDESVGEPPLSITEVPAEVLEAIVADAADRAGVEPQDVEITIAEAVTWSDGSLGCPEPGMMYTQALVPGYRVVVEAGGETLNFHAAQSGDFRFCENPKPPLERNPNE